RTTFSGKLIPPDRFFSDFSSAVRRNSSSSASVANGSGLPSTSTKVLQAGTAGGGGVWARVARARDTERARTSPTRGRRRPVMETSSRERFQERETAERYHRPDGSGPSASRLSAGPSARVRATAQSRARKFERRNSFETGFGIGADGASGSAGVTRGNTQRP